MLRHKAISLILTAALTVPVWASSGSSGPSKPEDNGKPDDRGGAANQGSSSSGPSKPEDSGKPDDRSGAANQGSSNSGPSKPEDNGKPDDRGGATNQGSSNRGPSKPEDSGKPDDRRQDNNPAVSPSAGPDNALRHSLAVTSAGQSVRASGFWETRVRGSRERLKVEIDADMRDGATFLVFVNNFAVGAIVLKLGEGELELDTNDNKALPDGVSPVSAIRSVKVMASNGAFVLEGRI